MDSVAATRYRVLSLSAAGLLMMAGCASAGRPSTSAAEGAGADRPTAAPTSVGGTPTTSGGDVDPYAASPTTAGSTPPSMSGDIGSPTTGPADTTTTALVQGTIRTPAGGSLAASSLSASPRCGPDGSRTALADLSWSPAGQPGSEQVVQLTTFQNGLDNGRYEASTSLPGNASTFTWPKVNPNGVHIWRVLTRQGGDWVASAAHEFTGPVCVGDPVGIGPP